MAEKYSDDRRIRVLIDGRARGITARLNQAISLGSESKFFARMDGDDVSYPDRFERQIDLLEADPRSDLLGTSVLVFADAGEVLGWRQVPRVHREICARPESGFPMAHPTWCGKRAWFQRWGYDERAVGCEDQDLLRRSWRESRFSNLTEILLGYREHQIRLPAALRTRWSTVASVARAEARGDWSTAVRAGLEQTAKAAAEATAWATRRDDWVRSRQREPLRQSDMVAWANVWKRLDG